MLESVIQLSSLNGDNGFSLNGTEAQERSGSSVSIIGDVNGDGLDDLAIAAVGRPDNNPNNVGKVYVVFGSNQAFPSSSDLSTLDGEKGFTITSNRVKDGLGRAVSGVGDINGDGIDDLAVTAPGANINSAGQTYIIFGRRNGFPTSLRLSSLNGNNGFRIDGQAEDAVLGVSVSGGGDINGDGIADLIVGSPGAGESLIKGQTYVIFGTRERFEASFSVRDINGDNGFIIEGISEEDNFGGSVSSVGDINGDGLDDLAVGAKEAYNTRGEQTGQAYIIFGKTSPFPRLLELFTLNGTNGFTVNGFAEGDRFGASISNAGDLNNDGIQDVVIGAPESSVNGTDSGQSYILFGARNFSSVLDVSNLNGRNGFVIDGVNPDDLLGSAVSGAGDVNKDGIQDVVIGARGFDTNVRNSGRSYVIFGKQGSFSSRFALSSLNGNNGFSLLGNGRFARAGNSVSGGGDLNGDNIDDLAIGAIGAGTSESGITYVVFGSDNTLPNIFMSTDNVDVNPEGDRNTREIQIQVKLSARSNRPITVRYNTLDGTATTPSDYIANSGTLTFNPGEIRKNITVTVKGDISDESNETFSVNLSNANNANIDPLKKQTTLTIIDDDSIPEISINSINVREGNSGNKTANLTVRLSEITDKPVTLQYATANDEAQSPNDYIQSRGTLNFRPGELSKNIRVQIVGDRNLEQDENFFVNLSNPLNAIIADTQGVVTITDDEPIPTISINNVELSEGNSGNTAFNFNVTLSSPSNTDVTVRYATANGTASTPSDYQAKQGTLTFRPGETTKTVTVNVKGDPVIEPQENFFVNLSNANNATIRTPIGQGRILNDDRPLTVNLVLPPDPEVDEDDILRVVVQLSAPTSDNVSVRYTTQNGTARAGEDYITTSGTLRFGSGTRATISVPIQEDNIRESDERFNIFFRDAVGVRLPDRDLIVTINDNDSSSRLNGFVDYQANLGIKSIFS